MGKPEPQMGTATFLFTDVEGSTQLWENYPDAMPTALAAHDAALRAAVAAHRGDVIKGTGDGILAVFALPADAVRAALAAQRALRAQEPASGDAPRIRGRMALHSGEAQARDGDYFGGTLNRLARLMAIGYGGQVLLSGATCALLRECPPGAATLLDMGEHRLKDLTQPEHVYQLSAPDLPREFPPLKSLGTYRHNLPVQLTSFVGREAELADVMRLLAGTRLLTLIGPGGTGKTRLSLQAASELLDNFPDGVWFAELAPVSDPEQVEQAVAAAFGVRPPDGVPPSRALADFVRYKHLLLLLDNCEHLIEAAARVAQHLLQVGPQVKIISSSREGLAIPGETIYQVPSLGVPPEGAADPQALAQSPAVRLFVERAAAMLPSFALGAENAPAVAEICRRLDGIPLAIELAAARVRLLPPAQIAARLREHFRLLAGGSRTAMPRQQTLQALIDWSWKLLSEDERTVLRRLSVFAGGWTLEAAEQVAQPEDAAFDVLEWLGQLVNKSLVIVQEHGDAARYRLLETVRQFARDKLLEAGESAAIHERHARHFLRLAAEYEPRLYGPEMGLWLDRYEADAGNFGAAYEWLAESDPLSALHLANAISFAFMRKARHVESERRMSDAVRRVRALPPPDTLERRTALVLGLEHLSNNYRLLGEMRRGREVATEGLQLARELGSHALQAVLLGGLAMFDIVAGNFPLGEAESEEALAFANAEGQTTDLGKRVGFFNDALMGNRALIAAIQGDSARAMSLAEESMRRVRPGGNPMAIGLTAMGAARVAAMLGDFEKAHPWIEEGIATFDRLGDRVLAWSLRTERGHILRRQGRVDEARAVYRQSIGWFLEIGNLGAVANLLECFAILALGDGGAEPAARLFGAAECLRQASDAPMWAHERVEYDAALERLRAALDPATLERIWLEGARLSPKEAIELAVQDSSKSPESGTMRPPM